MAHNLHSEHSVSTVTAWLDERNENTKHWLNIVFKKPIYSNGDNEHVNNDRAKQLMLNRCILANFGKKLGKPLWRR